MKYTIDEAAKEITLHDTDGMMLNELHELISRLVNAFESFTVRFAEKPSIGIPSEPESPRTNTSPVPGVVPYTPPYVPTVVDDIFPQPMKIWYDNPYPDDCPTMCVDSELPYWSTFEETTC